MTKVFSTFLSLFLITSFARGANFLVVEGKLTDSSGLTPIEAANVDFIFEVYDNIGNCLLYSEAHNANDMTGSKGFFSFKLGQGSRSGSDFDDVSNFADILNNSESHTGITTCSTGNNYNPPGGASRLLRITYDDGNGPQTLQQDIEIGATAFALSAQKIDGLSSGDLLKVNTSGLDLSQSNLENIFSTANHTKLLDLLAGTSTLYNSGVPTAPVDNNGQKIQNLDDPTASNDAVNKNYADTKIGGQNVNTAVLSTLSAGDVGEVLNWDGTQWTSAPPAGDSTKLPLDGTGTMTGNLDMGAQNIINVNDITVNNDLTVSNNVIITAGIGVGTGINSGGNIHLDNENELQLGDADDSNFVGFKAPAIVPSDITWTLPSSDGNTGEVLSTDGSGNLSWFDPGAVGVASFLGRTGVVVPAASDYDANQIDNAPSGDIVATNVQTAINELDTEKVAKSGDSMTGTLQMDSTNEIRFGDADNSDYVGFVAPAIVGSNQIWVLPSADGAINEVLSTDGSGNLSFIPIPSAPIETVHGRTGAVIALSGDYNASQITNVANGNISSTNVQTAIDELDTEKVAISRMINTLADSGLSGGGDLNGDRSLQVDINGTTALGASAANGDEILIYDVSGTVLRKVTRNELTLSEAEVDAFVADNGYGTGDFKADGTVDMTGNLDLNNNYIEDLASGSAGSPSLIFQGSSSTGIYSPATDEFAIAAAGSQVLRATASDVSITGALNVSGMVQANSYTSANPSPVFSANDYVVLHGNQDDGTGGIRFETGSGQTVQMVIANNGKIGMGVTSPVAKLDVNGAIKVGYDSSCSITSDKGKIRYNNGSDIFEGCNGTAWVPLQSKCDSGFNLVGVGGASYCIKAIASATAMNSANGYCNSQVTGAALCSPQQVQQAVQQHGAFPGDTYATNGIHYNGSTFDYIRVNESGNPVNVLSVTDSAANQAVMCCY